MSSVVNCSLEFSYVAPVVIDPRCVMQPLQESNIARVVHACDHDRGKSLMGGDSLPQGGAPSPLISWIFRFRLHSRHFVRKGGDSLPQSGVPPPSLFVVIHRLCFSVCGDCFCSPTRVGSSVLPREGFSHFCWRVSSPATWFLVWSGKGWGNDRSSLDLATFSGLWCPVFSSYLSFAPLVFLGGILSPSSSLPASVLLEIATHAIV
ncbi:hypothetical protein Taro_049879 [Colocasia esculenta]|uniref:Uncharacterized protein n=1 Tax=Colocasia esculenta TaxID=4460 RepID=A0A843XC70_COLES|nr:hypothetical protein [Colocasia esculenta]